MIQNLKIKNFCSIIDAEIDFDKLTILVGANGTGKTNIVKCLQFISAVPNKGLEATITTFGGMISIFPKLLSREEMKSARVDIEYTIELDPPEEYPKDLLPILVDHHLRIGTFSKDDFKLDIEEITFHRALTIMDHLSIGKNEKREVSKDYNFIKVIRRFNKNDKLTFSTGLNNQNINLISSWMGIDQILFPKDITNDIKRVRKLISVLENRKSNRKKRDEKITSKQDALIEMAGISPITFSTETKKFAQIVSSMRHYSLLQHQLRQEQPVSASQMITFEGGNMPSALRHMKKYDSIAFDRIMETVKQLNPFVSSAEVGKMGSAKEFISFVEKELKNNVESWETSDGTLRSLAILLALETHPRNSTIIIEEPEQNLHPWAIRFLIQHVRAASIERNIQVIMTTHSQQLLENVHANEVRIVTRSTTEGTKIRSLKEISPNHSIEMGEVGRLWGKGLLGGVPSYE